jgi:hypothetical protein
LISHTVRSNLLLSGRSLSGKIEAHQSTGPPKRYYK